MISKRRLSPFAADGNERAAKTLTYTIGSYLLQDWVAHLVAITEVDRAMIVGAAAGVASIIGSWVSRWVGQPGTASMTRTYAYGDQVPQPRVTGFVRAARRESRLGLRKPPDSL